MYYSDSLYIHAALNSNLKYIIHVENRDFVVIGLRYVDSSNFCAFVYGFANWQCPKSCLLNLQRKIQKKKLHKMHPVFGKRNIIADYMGSFGIGKLKVQSHKRTVDSFVGRTSWLPSVEYIRYGLAQKMPPILDTHVLIWRTCLYFRTSSTCASSHLRTLPKRGKLWSTPFVLLLLQPPGSPPPTSTAQILCSLANNTCPLPIPR